jgi:pimeloyl-ACP methyl ester carboxylesterase
LERDKTVKREDVKRDRTRPATHRGLTRSFAVLRNLWDPSFRLLAPGFWLLTAVFCLLATGCATPTNPSFPVSITHGRAALKEMEADPRALVRPLVVIGGFFDPGFSTWALGTEFRTLSAKHGTIITDTIFWHLSFWGYRKSLLDQLDRELPADKNGQRPEADVIGFSLGGLVARYAAIPQSDGRPPLRIARLFTISTPHRGSALAEDLPPLLSIQREVRYHSARLQELDNAPRNYPIYPYVRLGDVTVGAKNASPPGQRPWWVYTPWFNFAHEGAPLDPRILADIALRMRDEPAFSTEPPAPLPK